MTKNLPGLECKGGRLVLRGVGLLERTKGGYRLSEAGVELAEAYRDDPTGREWTRLLARLLLTREPRTRTFIRLMSSDNARLYFTAGEWWGGSLSHAVITCADGSQIAPFAASDDSLPNLRPAIIQNAWWALGAWRESPLINGAESCRFVGRLKDDFSMHAISVPLRGACEVFLLLGVLRSRMDECWLDHDVARREFGADLAEDFGWKTLGADRSLADILTELIPLLQMDTGFIVASELRCKLRQHGVDNPDREMSRLESAGRIVIESTDYGQSRHGTGLYDDPAKQLIRIRLC
ncbi:hypothetical protein [Maioricimonas rarisocia]|uniref:hypothetical protein n=1 Tax=Maioricimonas rarisocia TaxID=2528026 RepID=UPI0011A4A765|nr:hypothetical protein [Maioricimonas rarisocia]